MSSGVYKIINRINGKFYIGSSLNLTQRRSAHRYRAKQEKGNSIIRSAVKKYGVDALEFSVLEELHFGSWASKEYKLEMLTNREQYYVDTLEPEYNIRKDVTTSKGVCTKAVLDHVKKLADSRRGKKDLLLRNHRCVIVYRGNSLIDRCQSMVEAGRKYGIDPSNVSRDCKEKAFGKRRTREIYFRLDSEQCN